jgi:signal transduction histidine kinase
MKKLRVGVAIFLLISFVANAKDKPTIQNGTLDLTSHNWQEDGIIDLTGYWEFYWNKFYDPAFFNDTNTTHTKNYIYVPSFWNDAVPGAKKSDPVFGYATYRAVIKCPDSPQELALKFLTVESAYRLFVNGKEILNVGYADTSISETIADLKPAIVTVHPENNQLDIVVQVSNFHNRVGGLWDIIRLGTRQQVEAKFISNILLECFVAGCFFIAGIYYLILYFSFPDRYTLLFFSLLCFIIFTRSLVIGEIPLFHITSWNWHVARRLEYISLYLSVPVMCLFSYFLFPEDFSKKALYLVLPVCGIFILLSFFGPYYYYTYVVRYYQAIILVTALYGLYVYIKAAIKKRPGSLLFLAGFCIFLITIINDLLYVNLVIRTVPLFYAGLAIFIITLSILLSKQFSDTFFQLQVANKRLSLTNEELGIMNKAIEHKHKELKKINTEMDAFVNRTSHDLRAPLNSILGITILAKEEKNNETLQKYLGIQEKTLIRMDSLISDIIDFSKNKRLELELKEVDFAQLVSNSLEDHAFLNNAQKLDKKIDIKQYEKFVSDPRRVSIILNNLVSNAFKYADYTKKNPEISINILVADNMAAIEIADNGIGIEEQHLDKIFTLFYRVTNSSTGSGLGLYIIKETVDKLGGYVIINSKKGDGTSIKVMLPNIGYKL